MQRSSFSSVPKPSLEPCAGFPVSNDTASLRALGLFTYVRDMVKMVNQQTWFEKKVLERSDPPNPGR
jgi:hypothetical protein